MSGIVANLREGDLPLYRSAADEIERLTADLKEVREWAKGDIQRLTVEGTRLRAEIERLQSCLYAQEMDKQAEIERLTTALVDIAHYDVWHKGNDGTWTDISRIARLALNHNP